METIIILVVILGLAIVLYVLKNKKSMLVPTPSTITNITPITNITTNLNYDGGVINIINNSSSGTIIRITVNSIETTGDSYDSGSIRYTDQIGSYTVRAYMSNTGSVAKVTLIDYNCRKFAGSDHPIIATWLAVDTTIPLNVFVEDGFCG